MVALAPAHDAPGCPPRSQLVEFDSGLLAPPELDSVSDHLLSCDRCAQALDELHSRPAHDPVLDYVKRCVASPPAPVAGPCAEMAEAARAMRPTGPACDHDPAPAPEAGLPAGYRVGRYELLDKIGQGGMGVVYRASQSPLGRAVALKMILSGHHARPSVVARFVREGQVLGRLGHPNVVRVHDLDVHEGLPFLSMELVEGGTLQAKLADGPMEPKAAAELLCTLARAVEYAHGEGVIHRDLKPSNILIARDGTPRITDFGLAKLLDPESDGPGSAGLTGSDEIMGTASYMAPEQVEGRTADIGPRTDVYALGAILYELLTGRPPFVGPTQLKTLDLVRSARPVRPSCVRGGLPYWLEAICLTCLEKSPDRRYDTAGALADDLDRWRQGERPKGTRGRLARLARRLRRPALASTIALALVATAAAVLGRDPDRVVHQLQSALAGGRPVSLIDPSGRPAWARWQVGEERAGVVPAGDGTARVQAWRTSLLELLPDPQCQRYRFTAQIRHEDSADVLSEVGLYVARTSYPGPVRDVQFFTQVTFNARRSINERLLQVVPTAASHRITRDNVVQMYPRLWSDHDVRPYVDWQIGKVRGPSFKPREESDRWHTLEVVVTPERISAWWDGQPFGVSTVEIQRGVDDQLAKTPPRPAGPLPRDIRPRFDPRGGLGLYIAYSSAYFRAVRVIPL